MTGDAGADSPIERYLDGLLSAGRDGDPRQVRHLLAEAEAHLRDAAAVAQASGLSPVAAESEAVARFGPAADLHQEDRDRSQPSYRHLMVQAWFSLVLLGGVGAVAVGVSGAIAAILRAVGGDRLVAFVSSGQVLSASDCARWLGFQPHASSCRAAAMSDWAAEAVYYRLGIGVIGLCALAMLAWVRRHGRAKGVVTILPPLAVDTIAFTAFLLSGLWTLGLGIDAAVVAGGAGSGQWFSAAPVALAAAVVFGWRLLIDLRNPQRGRIPGRPTPAPATTA